MATEDYTGALTSAILELAKIIELLLSLEWQAEHYGMPPL